LLLAHSHIYFDCFEGDRSQVIACYLASLQDGKLLGDEVELVRFEVCK
jgi:hypothetical protein